MGTVGYPYLVLSLTVNLGDTRYVHYQPEREISSQVPYRAEAACIFMVRLQGTVLGQGIVFIGGKGKLLKTN